MHKFVVTSARIFTVTAFFSIEIKKGFQSHIHFANAKEALINHKDDEFKFPIADGTTKLSGRDYEFRVPTPRREPSVRSEDLKREIHSESGECQLAEPTDDAADFWSIQGDFIYRHHNESRVQHYVPKEETYPIPLKNIDVTRSTHTDLDVLQEKKIDDYWNRVKQTFVRFLKRIHKIHSVEKKNSKRIDVVRGETDKDPNNYQTRSCIARSLDEHW